MKFSASCLFLLLLVCFCQLVAIGAEEKAEKSAADIEDLEGLEKRFGAVPMGFMDKRFGAVPMGFMDKKSAGADKRFGAIPMGFIDKKASRYSSRGAGIRRYGKRPYDEENEEEK